jgi:hypothetical protein
MNPCASSRSSCVWLLKRTDMCWKVMTPAASAIDGSVAGAVNRDLTYRGPCYSAGRVAIYRDRALSLSQSIGLPDGLQSPVVRGSMRVLRSGRRRYRRTASALAAGFCFLLAACTVGPTVPKGQLTMQGRGAEALTNDGDPLLGDGVGARKVPVEFAKGYTKGISDQVKRGYWARQDAQKSDPDVQGRIRYYDATLPEREDPDGVVRVQRRVVIPIVE